MKTVVIASSMLIASAGAALAADAVITPGPLSAPPAFPARASQGPVVRPGPFDAPPAYGPPPFRVYNWTGFYLGLNGGGAFAKTGWGSLPDLTTGNVSNLSGLFGGTIGYNLQAGDSVVLGAEADLDWSGLTATIPAASAPSCITNCQLSMPWLATVRLRGGYSFGGVLPYVTGGVAITHFDANIAGTPFGTQLSDNLGWTAGGGVEFVITGDWRAKVEYLYMDLNGFTCTVACNGALSLNPRVNVFRAGVNYRLWAD
jgi:outer membrane immunogenic protein